MRDRTLSWLDDTTPGAKLTDSTRIMQDGKKPGHDKATARYRSKTVSRRLTYHTEMTTRHCLVG
jgi:hypothetical protein